MAPLIAPGYLAYAGLGLLRAPGTWLGDLLLSSAGGPVSWPLLAGRVLAILALALWVWPLPCLALCMAMRRVDPWVWEALRLEPAGAPRRWIERIVLARAGVVAGVVITALVMIGTAVPLHLAGVGTYAIELWAALSATTSDEQWRVHVASWPMIVVAMTGAGAVLIGLTRWAARRTGHEDAPPRPSRWWRLAPIAAVALSVGVPGALLVVDLVTSAGASTSDAGAAGHIFGPVRTFLRLHADALVDSLGVALLVLGAGVLIGLGVSALEHGAGRSRLATVTVALLVATALLPGVLVGSAILRTLSAVDWLRPALDAPSIVSVAHLARFGFIPAIVALWLARTTPPETLAMRRLDGAESLAGWTRTTLPVQLPAILAGALVAAALSLHEIEAAVMLAPPGADSLARRLLEMLHFSRMRELTAGTLVLLAIAFGWGVLLVLLGGMTGPRANRRAASPIR